jgi:hypothetical protein
MAVVLPGEADAAVELDHLFRRQLEGVARSGAEAARGQRQLFAVGRERPRRVVAVAARDLDLRVQLGEAVLHGLERRDGTPECVASERELTRDLEGARSAADLLEAHHHSGTVEQRLDPRGGARFGAQQLGRRVLERDLCDRATRVERPDAAARDSLRREIDQREHGAARALRDRHREPGVGGVEHGNLRAVQLAGCEARRDRRQIGFACGFCKGKGSDHFARRQARQPALLLLLAAGTQDCLGRQVHRARERNRRDGATDLLGDQHQLEVAEAGAAMGLGDHRAEPTHFCDALPERRVGTRSGRLEHLAADVEACVLRQVVARALLDELLVLGEFEIHAGGLRLTRESRRAQYSHGFSARGSRRAPGIREETKSIPSGGDGDPLRRIMGPLARTEAAKGGRSRWRPM